MIAISNDTQYSTSPMRTGRTADAGGDGFSQALLSYGGGSTFSLEDENSVSYDTSIDEEERTEAKDLLAEFSKWAHMDVAEMIRAKYLEDKGLTEESLAAMDPEARKAIEEEIAERIKNQLGVDKGATSGEVTELDQADAEI
ncbi:hypothetical protein C0075_06285 [Rhizobium sp. KAs_5_22]|uniref:hypothetical protein n=1 Tax=Ciceribacter selenitireducens TaxID=448181 RepID=UPI0004B37F6F|nr:hypothetical protein [Ciceribacter selenitireducens]PPJ45367.1 hypothetical protein C0075_06285 [Rhizobium sp. KAs_5_22]